MQETSSLSPFLATDTYSLTNFHQQQEPNSDDDVQIINNYHKSLSQHFNQQTKSFMFSSRDDLRVGSNTTELDRSIADILNSKQFSETSQNKAKQTETIGQMIRDVNRQKRRYLKQQSKRIKSQLKKQEQQIKKDKREFRSQGLIYQPGRKCKDQAQKRKKMHSKRKLQLLSRKFDEYYACESNKDYKGFKISLREIGKMFDMGSCVTIKLYREWMDDPTFYERINRENVKKRAPERRITLERLEHIARLLKANPFLTQSELTVELNKIQQLKDKKEGENVEITRSTVARLLKVGKFKKKRVKCVPKERNTTKSLEKREQYCRKYQEIFLKRAKIYFLDQSGFNLYMTRDKAWARPNQQITVNCPISKGKRFSLIAVISDDGLTRWQIIEGTFRKSQYMNFITSLCERLKMQQDQDLQDGPQQKWLILDNCAIHDKQQTAKVAISCNMHILFLPPYSPQLNPIQNWFNEVKCKVRKVNYTGQDQLLDIMARKLREYQSYDFSSYFGGIMKYVDKGVNREKF